MLEKSINMNWGKETTPPGLFQGVSTLFNAHTPSIDSCTKFLHALGASLAHNSISMSPNVVCKSTFPCVGGSVWYTFDII